MAGIRAAASAAKTAVGHGMPEVVRKVATSSALLGKELGAGNPRAGRSICQGIAQCALILSAPLEQSCGASLCTATDPVWAAPLDSNRTPNSSNAAMGWTMTGGMTADNASATTTCDCAPCRSHRGKRTLSGDCGGDQG